MPSSQLAPGLLGTWVHDSLQWRRRLQRSLHGTGQVSEVLSTLARTFRPRERFLCGGIRRLQQGLRGAGEKEESEASVRTGLVQPNP